MNSRDSLETTRKPYMVGKNHNGLINLYNTVPWQPFLLCVPPIAPDARSYDNLVKDMAELRRDATVKTAHSFRFVVRPYDEVAKDTVELREGSEILSIPRFGRSSGRTIAAQGEWPPVHTTQVLGNGDHNNSRSLIYSFATHDDPMPIPSPRCPAPYLAKDKMPTWSKYQITPGRKDIHSSIPTENVRAVNYNRTTE
ncbi:hypothetical protein H2248_004238 [Termitomyces sp. 'cryptogamus']|nr:hypothetical protein H2248_004238 [Termitomyces sp. 'cryptogamus']